MARRVPLPVTMLAALAATGCASRAPGVAPGAVEPPAPVPFSDSGAPLPPVPKVAGALAIRVVYPTEGQLITARDSNFVFGSVGNGDASLRINGTPVRVLPNGSFLAWLPVPPREQPAYQLEVSRGPDTLRVTHRVSVLPPRPQFAESGPLTVDSGSVTPRGVQAWLPNDRLRVSVRAPRSASVVVRTAAGREAALVNGSQAEAAPLAGGSAGSDGRFRTASGDPFLWSTDVPASWLEQPAALVVTRGPDSLRLALPRVGAIDSAGRRFARVGIIQGPLPDSDRTIIARPVPNGTYKWFLLPGTVAELTARAGDFARIRLDGALDVWVDANDVGVLPPGYAAPRRVASNARVVNALSGEWSEVIVPMGERPAYQVEELDDALAVTLYDTQANTDIVNYAAGAGEVRRVTWEQVSSDRARFRIALRHAPYGYFVRWDRGNFVIRVRRPPVVDKSKPLEGLRIAVDAGHPPAGSTGPTGLYEAVATLAIAERVKTYLEVRGAIVVMTRTAPGAVALGDRPVMARHANAQAFVSIHLNALPDGVNPMTAHGTGTYYFNARSEPLAREVQRSLVRHLGLRDLGINYDNLAVLRPTWMPSILCEGAFIIIPEQEAALRTPEFQDRYAKGVVEGLESYFLSFAK